MKLKVGIDLGGTKIAGIAFDAQDNVVAEARQPTPRGDYDATIACIAAMVAELADDAERTVGVGIPGSISPLTGQVQNANSTWINGKPVRQDLEDESRTSSERTTRGPASRGRQEDQQQEDDYRTSS